MSEHLEQSLTVRWFRIRFPKLANCLFAIPNGGRRDIGTAIKLKREGVIAGVPDLFLMVAKNGFNGLFIEMKTEKGRLAKSQKEFIEVANQQGFKVIVCHGFDEAKELITEYLIS